MSRIERERAGQIGPGDLRKVLSFEPVATSVRRGWEGLEVVHFRAAPAFEIDYVGQTHHGFTLFTRPPQEFALRFEGLTRSVPPPAGSIILVPAGIHVQARSSGFKDVLHVFLEPAVVDRVAVEAFDLDPARVLILPFDGQQHPQLRAAMLAVSAELTAEGGGERLAIESFANVLAVHLLRHAATPRGVVRSPDGVLPQASVNARRRRAAPRTGWRSCRWLTC
jgi:AraC family transcriptional regulator